MITYFDCSSGISGDMVLGALVHAGVSVSELKEGLSCLPLKGYELSSKRVKRGGFVSTKVDVAPRVHPGKGAYRTWKDVKELINRSSLKKNVKQSGLAVFKRLFEAEAKVHGSRYDRIHLHELGAVDCIVDIFGTLIGLDVLGVDTVYSSPVNVGSGSAKTEHGLLPVPAPATIELLKNRPVYSSHIACELTTPTGAVLLSSLASDFGPMPSMEVAKIGIGAGNRNFPDQPNILRIFIGSRRGKVRGRDDLITVVETNIDDMSPQMYEYVFEKLFEAKALDVFLTHGIMKKGRPGIKLTVLCREDTRENVMDIILRETTSIGVRYYESERRTLERTVQSVNSRYGKVRMKISKLDDGASKFSVEYDDCRRIAQKLKVPLIEIMQTLNKK